MRKDLPALAALVLLAALLRFTGLNWGIPTPEIRHPPFHPDEAWAMQVVAEVDVSRFQLNPTGAHLEGAFFYHVLTMLAVVLRGLGIIATLPPRFAAFGTDYATFLYAGRSLVVLLDLLTIVFVYRVVRRTTENRVSALFAAGVLAITPFEVVHAHFLRTHVPSNFLVVLVLFLSTSLYERSNDGLYRLLGFVCGLAMACRYPAGAVVCVPLLIILVQHWSQPAAEDSRRLWIGRVVMSPAIHRLLLFMAVGFMTADPFLFLDPRAARPHLNFIISFIPKSQFAGAGLLDLSRVWAVVSDLIPHGSLPCLWICFYASTAYALTRRRRYPFAVPLVVFLVVYVVPMAKGYTQEAVWVRAASATFPVFAILSGIAVGDIWERSRRSHAAVAALSVVVTAVCLPSLIYASAYVVSMARDDARLQLHEFLTRAAEKPLLRIGYYSDRGRIIIYSPTLVALRDRVTLLGLDGIDARTADVDYVLLGALEPPDPKRSEDIVRYLRATGRFELERVFANPISFKGVEFHYPRHPHDMQYPFPLIHLLKARPVSPSAHE